MGFPSAMFGFVFKNTTLFEKEVSTCEVSCGRRYDVNFELRKCSMTANTYTYSICALTYSLTHTHYAHHMDKAFVMKSE